MDTFVGFCKGQQGGERVDEHSQSRATTAERSMIGAAETARARTTPPSYLRRVRKPVSVVYRIIWDDECGQARQSWTDGMAVGGTVMGKSERGK